MIYSIVKFRFVTAFSGDNLYILSIKKRLVNGFF